MNSIRKSSQEHRTCAWLLLVLTLLLIGSSASANDGHLLPESGLTLLQAGESDPAERLAVLQVLSLYAHLYDDYETEIWGNLFTEEATFEIAYQEGGPESRSVWKGRKAIVSKLGARRAHFRATGVGRRHYLANPLVYELTANTARVSAYLMLTAISPDGKVLIEGSGRYDGRLSKGGNGWRIQAWRFTPDGKPVDFASDL